MSIVDPNAVSHSGAGACAESFLNPNAGTRAAEKTKTDKYKLLCEWTLYSAIVSDATSGPAADQDHTFYSKM